MFFLYQVVDQEGKELKGKVEASNRTNAITLLQSKGYTVLKLKLENSVGGLNLNIFQRVKIKDLVIFSKQISTLFDANISALRAFNLVASNTQNKYFANILGEIAGDIEKGSSLEKAFGKHIDVFGIFFVRVIGVGERSGTLSRSFTYLAENVEKSADLRRKLRKALTYPIFVIITFLAVMFMMFVTVIPQISTILVQSGKELPLITRIVIGISDGLIANLTIILLVLFGSIVVIFWWSRTEEGKKTLDSIWITSPIIGRLLSTYYLVLFTGNISVMLSAGVPIITALDTVQRIVGNAVYKDILSDVSNSVKQGASLSVALSRHPILSKNLEQMVKVGEETGELDNMLKVVSDFFQQQLQDTIDTTIDLIQPTIIVVLGLSVGVLIGSVILPIYSLSSAI